MVENANVGIKEEIAGILKELPQTFQIFASLYNEAKTRTRTCLGSKPTEQHLDTVPVEEEMTESMFDMIRRSLGELELMILSQIHEKGSKSDELAEKLGVSVETVKRRYKLLLSYGMVVTTRRWGVRLTAKGMKFLNLFRTMTH